MGGVGEEMRVLESREWYIASYAPQGVPNSDHLKIRTAKLSLALNLIPERHVVLETLFLSVIVAFGVGRVIKSNDTNYSEGDIVISPVTPLAEYCVVRLIKEEFGYDDAFNYHKEIDFDAALSKYFPNGIDVYLDNVGGRMLEAVLNHVNKHAKIPLCGMIPEYNRVIKFVQVWTEREGVRNLLNLVGKEVHMQGFMLGSYMDRFGDFAKEMDGHLKQGKIGSKLKIFHGIDKFLDSLGSLFTGQL
ncbi:NADPH-dependent oxidoreductase 2-alkenal reductase-like [Prunus avium]|uniref:NADPH-dependent oxidoreductase 2-alkenal reductase-like n=1 Tax=Prunus avium TaxID=42229 RepID=A0A6P5T6U8_PRUAV|nr:NADPH-dependent oxidoreductase 2-alkenal reductase-like [Prunus avium]